MAHTLGRRFIPIRKKRDHRVIGQEVHGVDTMEDPRRRHPRAMRVLLVDDLIATGGTAGAAIDLIRKSGGEVVSAAFVIDLPDERFGQAIKAKGVKVHALVSFEGR